MNVMMQTATETAPRMQRAHGVASVAVGARGNKTVLADLYQHANAKLRVPKTFGSALESVLINTAGGITGGDTLQLSAYAGPGSELVVTTQACERLYRSVDGTPCQITNRLTVDDGAFAAWMPQETIAFDGAAMRRTLDVDLAPEAACLIHESIIFGRALMGEVPQAVFVDDRWMVRRAGRPIHAERLRLDGPFSKPLDAVAALKGHTVMTTLALFPAPREAGDRLVLMADSLRSAGNGHDGVTLGVSAFDDKVICRMLATNSRAMRGLLPELVAIMRPGSALPKVWRL